MIQDLKISNFKCFHDVHLRDLGRFNVIVGRNGGGKTAFLEALFLLASVGPELVLKIRRMRGLGDSVAISAERGSFESLWRDLFFDFDQTSTIALRSVGTDENTRSLTVSYGPPAGTTLPFGKGSVEERMRHATIDFEYGLANGNAVKCQSALTSQGVSFGAVVETFPAILLSPVVREGPEHRAACSRQSGNDRRRHARQPVHGHLHDAEGQRDRSARDASC